MTTPSLDINAITQTTTPAFEAPTVNLNPGLTISLAVNDQDIRDHLMITFAKPGDVTFPEMLSKDSTSRLLYEIEQKGQNISEASLMGIADETGHARRLFVTPCPGDNFRDYAVWVGMVTDTVVNLKARKIALYPCPGALSEEHAFDLTCQLVRSLIDAKAADQIALVVGRYNYTKILNMALELKSELRSSDLPVKVIH